MGPMLIKVDYRGPEPLYKKVTFAKIIDTTKIAATDLRDTWSAVSRTSVRSHVTLQRPTSGQLLVQVLIPQLKKIKQSSQFRKIARLNRKKSLSLLSFSFIGVSFSPVMSEKLFLDFFQTSHLRFQVRDKQFRSKKVVANHSIASKGVLRIRSTKRWE